MSLDSEARAKLMAEARSRLIWGTRRDQVHAWLVTRGLDPVTADRELAVTIIEMKRDLKSKATLDLMVAGPLILITGWGLTATGFGHSTWETILFVLPGVGGFVLMMRAISRFIATLQE